MIGSGSLKNGIAPITSRLRCPVILDVRANATIASTVISLSESLHNHCAGETMQLVVNCKSTLLVRCELNHRNLSGLHIIFFRYVERLERDTMLRDQADVEDGDRNTILNGELLREYK